MRVRVVAHGRVQGVWFRGSTRDRAETLGVSGWAANRPDGTVEAVLEGDPDAVDAVVRGMREGPRSADVDRLDVTDEEPEGLSGFDVR